MAQSRGGNWIFKMLVLGGLILITLLVIQGSIFLFSAGGPGQGEPVDVQIPQGATTAGIARILEDRGVVRHALIFRAYVRYKEMDGKLQAGKYRLYENMNLADLLEALQQGRVYREQTRFTVPEGLRVEDVAARLASAGLGDEKVFLELMASPEEFNYAFLAEIPPGLEYPLEGYLAPDTYFVDRDASGTDVLKVLLQGFSAFHTEENLERLEEMGLTFHEAVTLAAIVERETRVAEERPVVAAVFLNRLALRMRLESCATVQYALGESKPRLLYRDLEIDSPYNTYKIMGLPPGPIASPGRSSLEAVLNPADVDYLYFVHRDDGTGRHYFALDFGGHQENIRKAQENRRNNN